MKYTKILAVLLALITVFSLCACKNDEEAAETTKDDVVTTISDSAEETTTEADSEEETTTEEAEVTTKETESSEGNTDRGADDYEGGIVPSAYANFSVPDTKTYDELRSSTMWQDTNYNKETGEGQFIFVEDGRLKLSSGAIGGGNAWPCNMISGHTYRLYVYGWGNAAFGVRLSDGKDRRLINLDENQAYAQIKSLDFTVPDGVTPSNSFLTVQKAVPVGDAYIEWYQIVDITPPPTPSSEDFVLELDGIFADPTFDKGQGIFSQISQGSGKVEGGQFLLSMDNGSCMVQEWEHQAAFEAGAYDVYFRATVKDGAIGSYAIFKIGGDKNQARVTGIIDGEDRVVRLDYDGTTNKSFQFAAAGSGTIVFDYIQVVPAE